MFRWFLIYICMGVQGWIWLSGHSQDTWLTITVHLSIKQSRWIWHILFSDLQIHWFIISQCPIFLHSPPISCVLKGTPHILMCWGLGKHTIINHFIYKVFALISQSFNNKTNVLLNKTHIYFVAKAHFLGSAQPTSIYRNVCQLVS